MCKMELKALEGPAGEKNESGCEVGTSLQDQPFVGILEFRLSNARMSAFFRREGGWGGEWGVQFPLEISQTLDVSK